MIGFMGLVCADWDGNVKPICLTDSRIIENVKKIFGNRFPKAMIILK